MSFDSFNRSVGDVKTLFGSVSPTASGSDVAGDTYINFSTGECYTYDGTAWILDGTISSGGGGNTQVLPTTQNTTLNVPTEITGLGGFTPVANATYAIDFAFGMQSGLAINGPQISLATPTGLLNFPYSMWIANLSYTTEVARYGGPLATLTATGSPAANTTYLATGQAIAVVGPTPGVGNIRPRLQSEINGQTSRIVAGSYFSWEQIA